MGPQPETGGRRRPGPMRPRLATLAPCSPNATNQQSQLWPKPYPAVTERERPTGELLRRRDAVLQRSPDARDALRLDGAPPVVTASAALKKRRSSYTVVRHVLRARDGRFPHPNVRPHHFVPPAVRNDVKTRSRLRSRGPGPESQSRSEGASGGDTGCLHRRQGRPAGPAASGVCTLRSPGTTRGRL